MDLNNRRREAFATLGALGFGKLCKSNTELQELTEKLLPPCLADPQLSSCLQEAIYANRTRFENGLKVLTNTDSFQRRTSMHHYASAQLPYYNNDLMSSTPFFNAQPYPDKMKETSNIPNEEQEPDRKAQEVFDSSSPNQKHGVKRKASTGVENVVPTGPEKRRQNRTSYTSDQLLEVETKFQVKQYISPADRSEIAGRLELSEVQVKTWFQNRRARWKRALKKTTGLNAVQLPKESGGSSFSDSGASTVTNGNDDLPIPVASQSIYTRSV